MKLEDALALEMLFDVDCCHSAYQPIILGLVVQSTFISHVERKLQLILDFV